MLNQCIESTNQDKHGLLHSAPPREHRAALKGGRPGLVPGRDLFSTWLQLNYSRQLEWSLPPQTTRLAADLVPAPRLKQI